MEICIWFFFVVFVFFIADTLLAICINICVEKHLEEKISYYYYVMRYNYVRMMVMFNPVVKYVGVVEMLPTLL